MIRRPNCGDATCLIGGIESSEPEFNKAGVGRRNRRHVVLLDLFGAWSAALTAFSCEARL